MKNQRNTYACAALFGAILFSCGHGLSSSSSYGSLPSNKATQILQGAGPVQVDLNKYNLANMEQIQREWTINKVQKAAENKVKIQLGVSSSQSLYVDVVQVSIPRLPKEGLGVFLEEISSQPQEETNGISLGLTLITGTVPGGPAEGLDIVPGDALSQIILIRRKTTSKGSQQEEFSAKMECLGFDDTVTAIQSLPPYQESSDEEFFQVSLKRIRRKPQVTLTLQYPPCQNLPDETIQLYAGENLRQAMLVRGVQLNDALAQRFDTKSSGNCGAGGLCRTCAVSILRGQDLLNPQRVAEQQMLQDSPRWRLACKAIVGYGMKEGEMTIRVNPRQWD